LRRINLLIHESNPNFTGTEGIPLVFQPVKHPVKSAREKQQVFSAKKLQGFPAQADRHL
jgi:hypothetical protein